MTGSAAEPHPLRAVVLAGGLTFEREVSLSSGGQVVEALHRAHVDAELTDADAGLLPGLSAHPADAVFIALHGATGEDGALRAVLDLAAGGEADLPLEGEPAGEHEGPQRVLTPGGGVGCCGGRVAHAWSSLWSLFAGPMTGGGAVAGRTAGKVPVSTASNVSGRSSSASMTRASRRTPSRIRSGSG